MKYFQWGVSVVTISSFFLSGCQQPLPDFSQKPFKKVCDYRLQDFHLSSDVRYFTFYQKPFKILCRYSPETYRTLSAKEKSRLEKAMREAEGKMALFIPPNACVIGTIPTRAIAYLDRAGEVHTVTNTRELRLFFGAIDTPAELLFWLDLNSKAPVCSYRKTLGGYTAQMCEWIRFPSGNRYEVASDGMIRGPK